MEIGAAVCVCAGRRHNPSNENSLVRRPSTVSVHWKSLRGANSGPNSGRHARHRRTKDQHTAHRHDDGVVLCYPYHPLAGQRASVRRIENLAGIAHYRLVTEAGEERLIPQWMCDCQSFDPTPVDQPFIDPVALLDLQRLVASALSSLDAQRHASDREEDHDAAESVSPTGGRQQAATRRRRQRSS